MTTGELRTPLQDERELRHELAVVPTVPRRHVFRTSEQQVGERVAVVGEFNGWSISSHPMTRRNGRFECAIDLAPGTYRYRFLFDGHRWENDWDADDYEPNAFGGEDSVVVIEAEPPIA